MVWIEMHLMTKWVCPGGSDSKELICNVGDLGSIPGMGRSSGEGNGNPLQYFCLENPMDRGAWWATVHGVTVLDMMEWLSVSMCVHGQTHTHTHTQKQNISSFKERTECYSGMFPPLWVAFLSILFFFFFLLVLFPSVCSHTTPMPAKSLPWFLSVSPTFLSVLETTW